MSDGAEARADARLGLWDEAVPPSDSADHHLNSHPWVPLRILSLERFKASATSTVLDEEITNWRRPPAEFALDLSRSSYARSIDPYLVALRNVSTRHVRGVYQSRLTDQFVYGSHHFYPFIGGETIQFPGVGDAVYRLNYHVEHQKLHRALKVPRIKRYEKDFYVNYKEVNTASTIHLDKPVFFGSPVEPTNWGMWLLQGLPSAWRFRNDRQEGCYLCFSSVPFQKKLLSFMGIDPDKVIDQRQWVSYQCRHLSALQYSSDMSFAVRPSDKEVYAELISDARRQVGVGLRGPKRIFVSRRSITKRKGGAYRALINEAELITHMEAIGYSIIEPEQLSFAEQIVAFNDAEVVVGLGGAGLFNTVFCRPGTKVVTIESSTAFVDNHATLFASLDLPFGVIFGERDVSDALHVHYKWRVDAAKVAATLATFA